METKNEAHEALRKAIKSSLKRRVARARQDLNYERKDLLEELDRYGLGRTPGSVSQIENGIRLPSVETLYVLAKYLDTSTDYLLGLTDNAASPADIEEELFEPKGRSKLEALMRTLPLDKQQQIMQFAEFVRIHYIASLSNSIAVTEEQQIAIESEKLLNSIERQRGTTIKEEIEKIFRDRNLPIHHTP